MFNYFNLRSVYLVYNNNIAIHICAHTHAYEWTRLHVARIVWSLQKINLSFRSNVRRLSGLGRDDNNIIIIISNSSRRARLRVWEESTNKKYVNVWELETMPSEHKETLYYSKTVYNFYNIIMVTKVTVFIADSTDERI